MQHFYAREIEANHRRREFQRHIEAHALVALAESRGNGMKEPGWRRWGIARWRSLGTPRSVIDLLLPTPMVMAERDA